MGTIYRVGIAIIIYSLAIVNFTLACDKQTMFVCQQNYTEASEKMLGKGNEEMHKHACDLLSIAKKCLLLAEQENCTNEIVRYEGVVGAYKSVAAACSNDSVQCNQQLIATCLKGVQVQLGNGTDELIPGTVDFGAAVMTTCENIAKAKTCIANRSTGCPVGVVSQYLAILEQIDKMYCSCDLNSVYKCQMNIYNKFNESSITKITNQDLASIKSTLKAACKLQQGMIRCRRMAEKCPELVKQSLGPNTTEMLPYDCNNQSEENQAMQCIDTMFRCNKTVQKVEKSGVGWETVSKVHCEFYSVLKDCASEMLACYPNLDELAPIRQFLPKLAKFCDEPSRNPSIKTDKQEKCMDAVSRCNKTVQEVKKRVGLDNVSKVHCEFYSELNVCASEMLACYPNTDELDSTQLLIKKVGKFCDELSRNQSKPKPAISNNAYDDLPTPYGVILQMLAAILFILSN